MLSNDELSALGDTPPNFRSGFAAVMGRPNVGKSTLVNTLLGQKIAIVSPKPQTTRNRLLGILTREDAQIIFVDTPGIHKPLHKLGEVLVETATAALPDADAIVWVVDVAARPNDEDRQVAAVLARAGGRLPVILALNKSDRLLPEHVVENSAAYAALAPGAQTQLVSATRGDNLDLLLAKIAAALAAWAAALSRRPGDGSATALHGGRVGARAGAVEPARRGAALGGGLCG